MRSRLFHTLVVYGAALGGVHLGCGSDPDAGAPAGALLRPDQSPDAESPAEELASGERCYLPDGTCNEHCAPLAGGGCLDPCFVHTETCSPDCLTLAGECGWPPTK